MEAPEGDLVELGKVTSVYGVKGWVKIYSHTEPMDNILGYSPWKIWLKGDWIEVEVAEGKRHGKGLIAQIAGYQDRDQARQLCGGVIAVERSRMPALDDQEFYWHQLENLKVLTECGAFLGQVAYLIATGSNDVLVVRGTSESLDRKERLIPYLPDQVIKEVDLENGVIRVDWDPEF